MKITGQILDDNNEPIASANIVKFGNKLISTRTNASGFFTIESDNINSFDNFSISYVGKKTVWKKATELQSAKIILPIDVEQLNEVIISPKPEYTNTKLTKSVDKKPLIYAGVGLLFVAGGFLLIKKVIV